MLPPTSELPAIKRIASFPLKTLNESLQYLRVIYNPRVRGSRRRIAPTSASWSRPSSSSSSGRIFEDDLLTDAFERAYSIKWLTALISQCGESSDDDTDANGTSPSNLSRGALIEKAASLLATCAGTASAGVITRHFVFEDPNVNRQTSIPCPITIDLRDVPLDNHDYGSVGAQTWGGECIMAEMIVEQPQVFGLPDFKTSRRFRCIELGAGTGLVSLTIAKILERQFPSQSDDTLNGDDVDLEMVATDYYPSVLANLERNVRSNLPHSASSSASRIRIFPCHLDWSQFCISESDTTAHDSEEDVLQTPFDVVYGADIIYEAQHAEWIKGCLRKLLKKPSLEASESVSEPEPDPIFHLIIPLRSTHTAESGTIEQVFRTQHNKHPSLTGNVNDDEDLVIKYKEVIICDAESGKDGEEVEYAYYRIGWGSNSSSEMGE